MRTVRRFMLIIGTLAMASQVQATRVSVDGGSLITDLSSLAPLFTEFGNKGQAWYTAKTMPATSNAVMPYILPFPIDIGEGSTWYLVCVAENGAMWFTHTPCPGTYTSGAPSGASNYIFPDQTDFTRSSPSGIDHNVTASAGIFDDATPYSPTEGREAAIFTWYDVNSPVKEETVQVVIVNGGGGDFELYFNWEENADSATGQHGLVLGDVSQFVTGAQTGMPDHFVFHDGEAQ